MSIANAVEEAKSRGVKTAVAKVPYWRTLKAHGYLNEEYPGGIEAHKRLLEREGFRINSRGKKYQLPTLKNTW